MNIYNVLRNAALGAVLATSATAFEIAGDYVNMPGSLVEDRWILVWAEDGDWITKHCANFTEEGVYSACVVEVQQINANRGARWCGAEWELCRGQQYLLPWHVSLAGSLVVAPGSSSRPQPEVVETPSPQPLIKPRVVVPEPVLLDPSQPVVDEDQLQPQPITTTKNSNSFLPAYISIGLLLFTVLVWLIYLMFWWLMRWLTHLRFVSHPDLASLNNHSVVWIALDPIKRCFYEITITTRRSHGDAQYKESYEWNVPSGTGKTSTPDQEIFRTPQAIAMAIQSAWRRGRLKPLAVQPHTAKDMPKHV